jgi:hypothetical protein
MRWSCDHGGITLTSLPFRSWPRPTASAPTWLVFASCGLLAVTTGRRVAFASPEAPEATASLSPAPAAPSPPVHADYVQVGASVNALFLLHPGDTCAAASPCILGGGGGLALRAGYRGASPWYVGGAYEFAKLDSSNLMRLAILQELRAEGRYAFDTGTRFAPHLLVGLGATILGNEWTADTGGGSARLGVGFEVELSRLVLVHATVSWRPVLLAGWVDGAGFERRVGVSHFLSLEVGLDPRDALWRR